MIAARENLPHAIHNYLEKAEHKERLGDLRGAAVDVRQAEAEVRDMADREVRIRDQARLFRNAKYLTTLADRLAGGKPALARDTKGEEPDDDEKERSSRIEALMSRPPVTWDHIGGMEKVKRSLKYTLGLILAQPTEGVRLESVNRILLYGPPGTGKTLFAAACANMLDAAFFGVKASDLLSRYFGESPRLVSSLFTRARRDARDNAAIVFIDEIDCLCRSRGDSLTGPELRILSTLLSELDGLSEKGRCTRVLVIAATNQPWSMDEALLQRFEKRIHVGLPDDDSRAAIFNACLRKTGLTLEKGLDCRSLAVRTPNYSGRLIHQVIKEAAQEMVRDMNPSVASRVDDRTIVDYRLRLRPLRRKDFAAALKRIRALSTTEAAEKHLEWARRMGSDHAYGRSS